MEERINIDRILKRIEEIYIKLDGLRSKKQIIDFEYFYELVTEEIESLLENKSFYEDSKSNTSTENTELYLECINIDKLLEELRKHRIINIIAINKIIKEKNIKMLEINNNEQRIKDIETQIREFDSSIEKAKQSFYNETKIEYDKYPEVLKESKLNYSFDEEFILKNELNFLNKELACIDKNETLGSKAEENKKSKK